MKKTKVKYTQHKPNNIGIIKGYSSIEVNIENSLIGRIGLGFGEDYTRFTIQDVKELQNLVSCLNNALSRIREDNMQSIPLGEIAESDIFIVNGSRSTYQGKERQTV